MSLDYSVFSVFHTRVKRHVPRLQISPITEQVNELV